MPRSHKVVGLILKPRVLRFPVLKQALPLCKLPWIRAQQQKQSEKILDKKNNFHEKEKLPTRVKSRFVEEHGWQVSCSVETE